MGCTFAPPAEDWPTCTGRPTGAGFSNSTHICSGFQHVSGGVVSTLATSLFGRSLLFSPAPLHWMSTFSCQALAYLVCFDSVLLSRMVCIGLIGVELRISKLPLPRARGGSDGCRKVDVITLSDAIISPFHIALALHTCVSDEKDSLSVRLNVA